MIEKKEYPSGIVDIFFDEKTKKTLIKKGYRKTLTKTEDLGSHIYTMIGFLKIIKKGKITITHFIYPIGDSANLESSIIYPFNPPIKLSEKIEDIENLEKIENKKNRHLLKSMKKSIEKTREKTEKLLPLLEIEL